MPQRKAAQKSLRADNARRERNLAIKRKIKAAIKQFLKTLSGKNLEEAKKRLDAVYKALDKAVIKKYIHKNKASRKKSRLTKKLKLLRKS
jgi:small subunit ribosomal protein S20